jgi:hypothetical protein
MYVNKQDFFGFELLNLLLYCAQFIFNVPQHFFDKGNILIS